MNGKRCAIGIDLGGQSLKMAVVDEQGQVHNRQSTPIDTQASAQTVSQFILHGVKRLLDEAREDHRLPLGVGMVMPGYMDRDCSRVVYCANLPNLSGSNLLVDLAENIELPVIFDADCNGAAWGEYRFGNGRGINRLIVATVGTGIGAGVILEGQVIRIRQHIAGSLGHVIVNAKGPRCACGGTGCLEAMAAAKALEHRAAELADEHGHSLLAKLRQERGHLGGKEVGEALRQDDQTAHQLVAELGWWLGAGIASWAAVYAPDKVLIGGGLAELGEPYIKAVRQGLRDVGQPYSTRELQIEKASLGPNAGIVGAAAMILPPPPIVIVGGK